MPNPVSAITSLPALDQIRPMQPAGKGGEFQSILEGTIQKLDAVQGDAAQAVQQFLTGETEELHSTVLATERAELVFDLGLQVRNKVISAYQEIMRMQM